MPPVPPKGPKKFIRTFAGDAATLQSGGTPDLVPFQDSHEAESITPSAPIQNAPIRITDSALATPSLQALVQQEPTIVVPPPTPAAAVVELSPPSAPIANLPETYASDFSTRVKDTNASTATILAAQQDSVRGAPSPAPVPQRGGSIWYVLGGFVLLLLAGGGAYYAYSHYLFLQEPIAITPTIAAPIFVDERVEISGIGQTLAQAVEQSVAHPLASGAVRFLYTTSATTTDNSVFSALQLPAPNVLLRNINAAGSMAGVLNVGGTQSPFFILAVDSYGETFAGMLSWETSMPRALAAFFPAYEVESAPTTTTIVASTTSATTTAPAKSTKTVAPPVSTTPVFVAAFHDEVIGNHDARVYRDAAHRSIVLYGYWDQKTLIIARDEAAFSELLRRLATSRSQQSI